jgi:sugar lactone lactonase YvrE
MELLWSDAIFTEGPAVAPDGSVYFTSIWTSRIMRFEPCSGKVTTYREKSGKANGLMFDREGRLVACEGSDGGNRRVSITGKDGKVRALANNFQGKKFNSPNDLAITTEGRIYFTDPRYVGNESRDLDFEGVYLIEPDGKVKLATKELQRPNGILISKDGETAFVADNHSDPTQNRHFSAFPILSDGTFGKKRILFDFGETRGIDGMAMDAEGNLYATAGSGETSGIYVFSPVGKHLALIPVPESPTNCQFGNGKEANTLYITAGVKRGNTKREMGAYGLFRIQTKIAGYHPATAD